MAGDAAMNPDWDGIMKARAREGKSRPVVVPQLQRPKYDILRAALERIYGTPELTWAEARQIAREALENTDP
jgi:hypothetical protein